MNEQPLIDVLANTNEPAHQRYMRLFVGKESIAALIRYEAITGLLGSWPGASGYYLRSKFYRLLLDRLGRGTVFGRGVVLRSPSRIAIGDQVMIDDYTVLDAKGEHSRIVLGDQILLGRNTILSCNEATIQLGSYVSIGPFCFFACKSFVRVGSNVSIGSGTHIMAGGHAFDDPDVPVIRQARIAKGITIEDNVWIGSGAKLLDGVTVGKNSIVGAGSVVGQDVPPGTVVLGNPARVIQRRKQAEKGS